MPYMSTRRPRRGSPPARRGSRRASHRADGPSARSMRRVTRWCAALGVAVFTTAVAMVGHAGPAGAHTPSATLTCVSWSIGAVYYDADDHNTFSYSLDGADAVTGSFGESFARSGGFPAGSGNHTLKGYIYEDDDPNAQYSTTFDLHTTGCTVSVPVPGAPSVSLPTCDHGGVLTVAAPGDHVTVSGGRSGDGPGEYTVTYSTDEGYTFPDGARTKTYEVTVPAQQ